MSVPIEFGTLPLGVEHAGQLCREFTLRPLQAKDLIDIRHSDDGKRILAIDETNPELSTELMGLGLIGKRIKIDGVPDDALTVDFMAQLWKEDLDEIMAAEGRLQAALTRFRGEDAPSDDPGAAAGGAPLGDGQDDAGGGSAAVDRGLGRTADAEETGASQGVAAAQAEETAQVAGQENYGRRKRDFFGFEEPSGMAPTEEEDPEYYQSMKNLAKKRLSPAGQQERDQTAEQPVDAEQQNAKQ